MQVRDLDGRFDCIKAAERRSITKLEALNEAGLQFQGSGVFLCINGSLARKELVAGSDFDAFAVVTAKKRVEPKMLWDVAEGLAGLASPGTSGVFGVESVTDFDEMLSNIGGSNDTNSKITQRMLFILESVPFGDLVAYDELVDAILMRYISDKITDHQLVLFLMNDLIRYYRTICVDFEFKTEEDGKPWGIRNIKLVFSRKLMYFSGLIMCAETVQRTPREKRHIFKKMIKSTPMERVLDVLGERAFPALVQYESFLKNMDDDQVREDLKSNDRDNLRKSELFRKLKNDGHHFSMALRNAFAGHYDSSHPIHRAIMF